MTTTFSAATEVALPPRVLVKIDFGADGGCWVWTACRNRKGYGMVRFAGKVRSAHRAVYTQLAGPIPEGMQLDHLCRVRACVNPAHLEVVTAQENTARGMGTSAHSVRTGFCERGHNLSDPENLIAAEATRGQRSCRPCAQARARRQASAIRAAHHALGMTKRAYIAEYGASRAIAESVIAERGAA